VALKVVEPAAFGFATYPRLAWPAFAPWIGVALLPLAVPAALGAESAR